ncbi:DUF2586 family protein [Flavobacterium laiguense]|uniref:DUF2586 domain-containing protein n=1 Tax=Flavobacterium laiguense TaxID=2169409 RepID=A0A2U1K0H4_9FLAO|nr:DUF2586 family protein [Flavobacterium laiguense]PWA10971.1 hypothetical protein DB891_03830 [Flavobacterium laiguense]
MSFEGVIINQGQGGLNRTETPTDAVMALVAFVNDPLTNAPNEVHQLLSVLDAEALGFDAAYDANEAVLLHYHISEFFRLAPNGTLKLVVTEKTTAKLFFESDTTKALFRANTDVKRIGFVYNNDVVALDIVQEIGACQVFINNLFLDKIYLNGIYLEARNVAKNAISRRTLGAGKVSLVIAQDPAIASLDAAYSHYAAVGSILGMRAVRKVNENLGSVDVISKPNAKKGELTYPLTDSLRGLWLSAALSNGTLVSSLADVEKRALTANGYIYAGSFQGFAGVYLNGEPTCIAISSDYSTGENNGVWDKAALGIRNALLPKVRGWFQRDAATGKLRDTAITSLENIGKKPLQAMLVAAEISGFDLVIPAGQNPNDQTPLMVKTTVTLGAIIHTFEVDLSLN